MVAGAANAVVAGAAYEVVIGCCIIIGCCTIGYEGITPEVLKAIRGGSSNNGCTSAASATGTGAGSSGLEAETFLLFFFVGFFPWAAMPPIAPTQQQQHATTRSHCQIGR